MRLEFTLANWKLKIHLSGDELVQIFYQKKEQMFTSGTICAKI